MMDIDLTTDYHSHILPQCDHGSDSIETSVQQIQMAKTAGIETIYATPHFYPTHESVSSFLERREKTSEALKAVLTEEDPLIRLGAEVLICDGMDRMADLERLCLEDSNKILLEMPFYDWSESIWNTVFRLNERESVQIIIAHADRYPVKDIEVLIAAGIPLQLNACALNRLLKRSKYLSWIDRGYVSYIGSDIHGLGNGYRDFEKCVRLLRRRYNR